MSVRTEADEKIERAELAIQEARGLIIESLALLEQGSYDAEYMFALEKSVTTLREISNSIC